MIDKEGIKAIIRKKIESDENIGEKAGGSGHLSSIDYIIDEISEPEKAGENYHIKYQYTVSITTEFTIYPDNPPHEYTREVVIEINNKGDILKEVSSKSINDNFIPFE